jgi:hypothetical protein
MMELARRKKIPQYSIIEINGFPYYRTFVEDGDGKRVVLYRKTQEELYDKALDSEEQIANNTFQCKMTPTVAEYCEKWLMMQSVHIRTTTMTDYTSKVRRHIIKELGHMHMGDVTPDDIQLAMVPVSKSRHLCISQLLSCSGLFLNRQRKAE